MKIVKLLIDMLVTLILSSVAVFGASYLFSGVTFDSTHALILTAIAFGIANVTIRPILHFISLPLSVITLGLFAFIVNGIVVLLVSWFIPGFSVDGIFTAILFSIVMGIINVILNAIFK